MEYLTTKEYKVLRENLEFYVSLDCGKRTPTSNSQKQFVSVCKGLEEAKTEHEIAYIKYKKAGLIYKKAGLIRPDLRSEEIIFKKISAQNKKNVIAPERNNISASKTRKPAIDPTVSQKPKPHKRIVDSLKIKRPKVKKIKMKLASFCKENFSKNTENKKLSKDFKPKPQAPREGIPEFEEGFPRSEFGSRDDHKKDSKGNFTDSRKNKLF